MPTITFREASGQVRVVDVEAGTSVMEAATANDISGIQGTCGGQCNCATCHVHVGEDWLDRLPGPQATETDLLEYLDGYSPRSRLGCQITVDEDLDGIVLDVVNEG